MNEHKISNAVIEAASISIDRGFILSSWLTLKFEHTGQGFGGYALYLSKSSDHHSGQPNIAGHWIYRILEVSGVESWDSLVGRTVRVKHDSPDFQAKIIGIGHIIKDDWFYPEDEFESLKQ